MFDKTKTTKERYYSKEPLIHFKKESTIMINVMMIGIGLGIMLLIGFTLLGSVYDAQHPQPKQNKDTESPYMIFVYFIPMLIILIPRILEKKKEKRFYNSEGRLVS